MRRWIKAIPLLAVFSLAGCGIFGISDLITGAEAGVAFVKQGKYETFDEVSYEDARAAVLRAGDALALTLEKNISKDGEGSIKFHDDRGLQIAITLHRRSKNVTATYIDVGIFGTTGMGRIMLAEIINQLLSAKAYKQSWDQLHTPPATSTRPASTSYIPENNHMPLGGESGMIMPRGPNRPLITVEPGAKE